MTYFINHHFWCHAIRPALIVISALMLSAPIFNESSADELASVPHPSRATINLYSQCETVYEDNKFIPAARPLAIVQFRWTEGVDISLNYTAQLPETALTDERTWNWYGTDINGYSTNLLSFGFILFDGKTFKVAQEPPSLVREKIAIGTPRTAQIANRTFSDCEDFLLKTDFGKRRTIECPNPGLIAEDHYSEIELAFYPVKRIVSSLDIDWSYPTYQYIDHAPPYQESLIKLLKSLAKHINFQVGCNVDFLTILRKR